MLKLDSTDMGHLAQSKITFIYNFSPVSAPNPLIGSLCSFIYLGGRSQASRLGGHNNCVWIVSYPKVAENYN